MSFCVFIIGIFFSNLYLWDKKTEIGRKYKWRGDSPNNHHIWFCNPRNYVNVKISSRRMHMYVKRACVHANWRKFMMICFKWLRGPACRARCELACLIEKRCIRRCIIWVDARCACNAQAQLLWKSARAPIVPRLLLKSADTLHSLGLILKTQQFLGKKDLFLFFVWNSENGAQSPNISNHFWNVEFHDCLGHH